MKHIQVIIVGAGPSGLSLGLALAKYDIEVSFTIYLISLVLTKVQTLILEKEQDVTEDPRGVYLAEDAIRILYELGIRDQMKKIGHGIYLNSLAHLELLKRNSCPKHKFSC